MNDPQRNSRPARWRKIPPESESREDGASGRQGIRTPEPRHGTTPGRRGARAPRNRQAPSAPSLPGSNRAGSGSDAEPIRSAPRPPLPAAAAGRHPPEHREHLRLQQHDLTPQAAAWLVARATVRHGERVVEVGPGTGSITRALLAAGAEVIACEMDPQRARALSQELPEALAAGRLRIIPADARTWTPARDGRPWRVVANPPFQHTAELLRGWVLAQDPPIKIDLLLQRQAAEKLCGSRHDGHSRSSALLAACGRSVILGGLPREAVSPPSHVDLALWAQRREPDAPDATVLRSLDAVLMQAFAGAHSMKLALRGLCTPEQVRRLSADGGWSLDAHPRTLSAAHWLAVVAILRHGRPAQRTSSSTSNRRPAAT